MKSPPFFAASILLTILDTASAHIGIGADRTLNSGQPIDGQTFTNNVRTVSSSFGWADGTDGTFGDSHRTTAFKFTLASVQSVTISVTRDNRGTGAPNTLLPAFSLYTLPGAFVTSTHDSAPATVNYLTGEFGTGAVGESFVDSNSNTLWNIGESFTDTNGNGVFDGAGLGGSGKKGAFRALDPWKIYQDVAPFSEMHFNSIVGHAADGSSANYGNAVGINGDGAADGFVTWTFNDLAAGDYYLFVGGANYLAQNTEAATFPSYGISLSVFAVPEPSSIMLFGVAAASLGLIRPKRVHTTRRDMTARFHGTSRTGFTLVELMVVVAIVGTLSLVGFSVTNGGIERAKSVQCLGIMRDVGVAMQVYTTDHSGRLPDTSHSRDANGNSLSWSKTLADYFDQDFVARCPSSKSKSAVTYAWNDLLTGTGGGGIPMSVCRSPGSTMALAEVRESYTSEHFHFAGARSRITYNQFKSSADVELHGKTANYLFVDGHTESLTPLEVGNRLNAANSTFLQP